MRALNVKVCEMEGREIVRYYFASVMSYTHLDAFRTVLKRAIWDPGEGDSSIFSQMTSI